MGPLLTTLTDSAAGSIAWVCDTEQATLTVTTTLFTLENAEMITKCKRASQITGGKKTEGLCFMF